MAISAVGGRYTSRSSPRFWSAVTIFIYRPVVISENKACCGPIHVNPEALGNQSLAAPPNDGTFQVSQFHCSLWVYAISDPSGEKAGPIFSDESFVSCTGSPSGSSLAQMSPAPLKVLSP